MQIINHILNNKNNPKHERHPFHLVDPSPWPILTAFSVFTLVLGFLLAFNNLVPWYDDEHIDMFEMTLANFSFFLFCLARWFRDVTIEATHEWQHTMKVQSNTLAGMQWFIVSEVMFFFSFFWAYFHFSLIPSVMSSGIWPLYKEVSPWSIPFCNTAILLSSGIVATAAHWSLKYNRHEDAWNHMNDVIHLAFLFTSLQIFEYGSLSFSISSSAFGSIFYMITGFHGLHVVIGTIFLYVCWIRLDIGHFLVKHHTGFICALWYWHFVDVVWIALFLIVYIWGKHDVCIGLVVANAAAFAMVFIIIWQTNLVINCILSLPSYVLRWDFWAEYLMFWCPVVVLYARALYWMFP